MLPEVAKVLELLEHGFCALRVLVVGDLMLDRYVEGDVERISPEAPVPVLRQAREYSRPGGAANVAMNLAGLGLQTSGAGDRRCRAGDGGAAGGGACAAAAAGCVVSDGHDERARDTRAGAGQARSCVAGEGA